MESQSTRGSGSDRTTRAVAAQLRAMGCETYEIGVRDAVSGKMMQRTWSAAEVEQGVPWLKHENAQGNDIYIRPAGSVGLVLLDDLDGPAIALLTGDGLAPAVVGAGGSAASILAHRVLNVLRPILALMIAATIANGL